MRAKDIMEKEVIFVRKEDKIEDIISSLKQNHVSGVPVVDKNNRLIGMVTERDLVTCEKGLKISSYVEFVASILFIDGQKQVDADREKIKKLTAEDVMTAPVYSVQLEATVEEIVSLMMNRHINRIPVIDKQSKLVGIIGRNDLLPALIQRW